MAAKGSTGEMFKALAKGPQRRLSRVRWRSRFRRCGLSVGVSGLLAGAKVRFGRCRRARRLRGWCGASIRIAAGSGRDTIAVTICFRPESCADLIEGFRQQGGQEFPAVVRRVTDGGDHSIMR